MSEEYIKFLTKENEFIKNKSKNENADLPYEGADSNDPLFNFNLENYLPVLFVVTLLGLLGFIFYLNSNHEAKDVAFEDAEGMPKLSLGNILGDKTSKTPTALPQRPTAEGPTFDASALRPSTSGKISFEPPISDGDSIDIYSTTHVVKGNLGLDGNYFYMAVYVNGTQQQIYSVSPDTGGVALSFDDAAIKVTSNDHDFNKFLIEVDDMNGGENTVRVALFSDESQTNKLDQIKFTLNRVNATEEVKVDYTEVEDVDKKAFFEEIGADLEKDKVWEYIPPVDVNWEPLTSKEFYGQNSKLAEYKIRKVGTVEVSGSEKSAYSISYYKQGTEEDRESGTYILGYSDGAQFYYFANATKIQDKKDSVLLTYMKAAPVSVKNSIIELSTFELDDSEGALYSDEKPFVCRSIDRAEGVLATQDDFKIYKNFTIEDPFGLCRQSFYRGEYFRGDSFSGVDHISDKYNSDFKKLDIDFDADIDADGYYSLYTYDCTDENFSGKKVRSYPANFDSHLEEVGETSDAFKVFLLKDSAPKPENPFEYGLLKYSKAKDESSISGDEWVGLIEDQDADYPLLIIENEFDSYYLFVKSDYVYKKEC